MSNTYFQFKQFKVEQEKCAMKVGTDGVLLGAWADVASASRILDIGTGTGLVALMLAQRQPAAQIEAIEIDEPACEQAIGNFKASPWSDRIECRNIAFQSYLKTETGRFDLIVSNPPYFVNSQKNPDKQRSQARHTDSLRFDELVQAATLLSENGKFCIILPSQAEKEILATAQPVGLHCTRKTDVLPKAGASPKRILLEFQKREHTCIHDQLTIEIGLRTYSTEFLQMIKEFYLEK